MAITRDGLYVSTLVAALTNTIALNLSSASAFKLAMFTDSLTPDFSAVSPAYGSSPYNANEVSGPGYTAGGIALASAVFEELPSTAGTVRFDFANISWSSSTITNAKAALIYVPGLSNVALLLRSFGQDYSTQDGTFAINLHADGIFKIGLLGPIL
ncbi:hypothetical protein ABT340_39675 [Streptosporangium sp. NPDC000239]|uniref:hypothetical protein n=1 Tax=Streptosporangium sp. NPDC000239 TaxID=3154248 RepID=UPI0033218B16